MMFLIAWKLNQWEIAFIETANFNLETVSEMFNQWGIAFRTTSFNLEIVNKMSNKLIIHLEVAAP